MDWMKNRQAKAKLKNAFHCGNIGVKYHNQFVFPFIHNCKVTADKTVFVFSVPVGLDPKEVQKRSYVFRQVFGSNVELEGRDKHFKLTVHRRSISSNHNYSYESIKPVIADMALPVIAGMDINGKILAYDMVNRPHLCLAGETGSGKSTELRAILTTMIKEKSPDQLRLFLGDMKRSEFHIFRNIAHVEGVYTRIHELKPVLERIRIEMQRRGDMLDQEEVSHIDELKESLPYLVLCIDEVALLKKEKALMEIVEEISAIGRALGCFLILSMQRPDRDILDGKLKNNLTVRMGFRCADAVNSRIIGTPGAENIGIGQKGRMVLKFEKLTEIQAPYLALERAKTLLEGYKSCRPEKASKRLYEAYEDVSETVEVVEDIFGVLIDEKA